MALAGSRRNVSGAEPPQLGQIRAPGGGSSLRAIGGFWCRAGTIVYRHIDLFRSVRDGFTRLRQLRHTAPLRADCGAIGATQSLKHHLFL
ncbi:hypothetical protein [Mycolicibacter virginiensis]|uniref:hypothetical protein n=1 Tax=Mycolicibacter virginiensis TaxID=1795032 RepID=UPI00217ED71A|nr:hypothetical protein [Mycolicibacter virginiensis]UVI51746.1 hypothetical protein MJO54_23660 [Mycolicibacter virginiensis]